MLTPASMAPVALDSFVVKDDETDSPRPSRRKRVFYGLGALASVGVVAYLAVALARHPPQPDTTAQAATPTIGAAATVVPAPSTPTVAVAVPPSAATTSTSEASATTNATSATSPATTAIAAASSTPGPKGKGARGAHPHGHARVAAASPVHAAAATRPVVIPASRPSGGNDSLMDLIKKSVASGK